jgi:hypothetical protein
MELRSRDVVEATVLGVVLVALVVLVVLAALPR